MLCHARCHLRFVIICQQKSYSFLKQLSTASVPFPFRPLATSTQIRPYQGNVSTQRENFDKKNNCFTNEFTFSGASESNGEILSGQISNKATNMSVRECDERFNRITFFIKNIKTSRTYMDAFMSILSIYPLAPISTNNKIKAVKYLCVAGNVFSMINSINRL